jgi:hypothetical protein
MKSLTPGLNISTRSTSPRSTANRQLIGRKQWFALAAQPHVRRVIAVDASLAMVALMRARGIEAVEGGFLTTSTRTDRSISCTAATRFTTCLTSGRPSLLIEWRGC